MADPMKQFLPFHEKYPTLHEVAIVAGLLLFFGFGFGWNYAFAGAVLLALLYLVSATVLWTRILRERQNRKTENRLVAPRRYGNGQ
jgi:Kef-type K+ transport system membrane component KefB